jgi:hypothetical protein
MAKEAREECCSSFLLSLSHEDYWVTYSSIFTLISFSTYKVVQKKGKTTIVSVHHKPECQSIPERSCKNTKCGYEKGHMEAKEQTRKEKEEKKAASQQKKQEESKKKREVAEEKKKARDEASKEKVIIKTKKLESKLRNGDLNQFAEAAGLGKDGNTASVLNQAVSLSRLFTTINPTQLYYPGVSRDNGLALQLGFELARGDSPPFNTNGKKNFLAFFFV